MEWWVDTGRLFLSPRNQELRTKKPRIPRIISDNTPGYEHSHPMPTLSRCHPCRHTYSQYSPHTHSSTTPPVLISTSYPIYVLFYLAFIALRHTRKHDPYRTDPGSTIRRTTYRTRNCGSTHYRTATKEPYKPLLYRTTPLTTTLTTMTTHYDSHHHSSLPHNPHFLTARVVTYRPGPPCHPSGASPGTVAPLATVLSTHMTPTTTTHHHPPYPSPTPTPCSPACFSSSVFSPCSRRASGHRVVLHHRAQPPVLRARSQRETPPLSRCTRATTPPRRAAT